MISFGPDLGSVQTFIPDHLLRSFPDFCKVLVKIFQLRIVALHHLPNSVTDILLSFRFLIKGVHVSLDFLKQSLQGFRVSGVRLIHIFLHCLQKCTGPRILLFLLHEIASIFFMILFLSPPPSLASSAKHPIILNISVSLLALSLQLLEQVFFVLPRPYPVPSPCGRFLPTYLWILSFPLVFRTLSDFFHW